MGLGKTLSMISLIASDLLVNRNDPNSLVGANAEESSGRTLIVVPPPRESDNQQFPTSSWLLQQANNWPPYTSSRFLGRAIETVTLPHESGEARASES